MDIKESRRRRRERIIIAATIVIIVVLTFVESHLSRTETLLPVSNDVLIFGLININIILALFLIFLIVRNVVKLVFERKRGVLGSKLRTKLVVAFVSLSLVPTVVLFLVSINFLSYSIDNWFNIKIGGALNQSLEVAQTYYQQSADSVKYCARQISSDITRNKLYEKEKRDYLKTLMEQRQRSFKLGLIEVYFDNQKEKLLVRGPDNPDIASIKLSPKILEDVYMGKEVSTVQSTSMGDFISGLVPIYSNLSPREVIGVVVAGSGTYFYVKGEMATDYFFSFDRVWTACKKVVADKHGIEVEPYKEISQGTIDAVIDGEKVHISVKYKAKNVTTVSIRVGLVGNRLSSQLLHDKIVDNLLKK